MTTPERQLATAIADGIPSQMRLLGQAAREAADLMGRTTTEAKNKALRGAARAMRDAESLILAANDIDMANARESGLSSAMLDRLKLTPDRIEETAAGLEAIAELPDPIGGVTAEWERPNGLVIQRVRVPLGVIGIIYESRPNVTADAGGLCLKSGNAVILRGGSEAVESNGAVLACLTQGLREAGLPETAIQRIPTQDRDAVGFLLRDMTEYLDVVVPRGGKNLIARVQQDARVPVMGHLEGLCHTYVHSSADLEMARAIAVNAKMRRTGICGATEAILVDSAVAATHIAPIVEDLIDAGCEVRGDAQVQAADSRVVAASDDDWGTEFLDAIVVMRVVADIDEAFDYIREYGSGHTDAIVTADAEAADRFLKELDSAIVMHNTSTQFADGGEFGMGAEIGIATGRIHARGPVGTEQLTSYKYVVRGTGQTRPS